MAYSKILRPFSPDKFVKAANFRPSATQKQTSHQRWDENFNLISVYQFKKISRLPTHVPSCFSCNLVELDGAPVRTPMQNQLSSRPQRTKFVPRVWERWTFLTGSNSGTKVSHGEGVPPLCGGVCMVGVGWGNDTATSIWPNFCFTAVQFCVPDVMALPFE